MKLAVALGAVLLLAALAAAGVWAYLDERDSRRADVTRLEGRVAAVQRDLVAARKENALLAARVRAVSARMRKARFNLTPLAARIRRSVFTVTAALDEGSGFAGWVADGSTYVLTANHVVTLSIRARKPYVVLRQQGRKWRGRVVRVDDENDLAVIRVPGRIAPPLWQRPVYRPPAPGDDLLLVGAPEGYEGSVTTGIVSRVTRQEVQTDVSAHPGVSGGPLVDANGTVVGVLSSGEGETLNFAVPIGVACLRIRNCR
ncbi:MAG TPA: S1C family serine protease [Gaiellaceae bacterium]|nr:S1C family serine protease [Gaiellaceae bacterium]